MYYITDPYSGSLHRGTWRWDEGGSREGASLSEEVLWRGPQGGGPFTGTLEDMLRKAPDMGISLHRGPFTTEGNLETGGGSYTRDFERCMTEGSWYRASLCEGFHEGDLERGLPAFEELGEALLSYGLLI
jgi:hypothetical protein